MSVCLTAGTKPGTVTAGDEGFSNNAVKSYWLQPYLTNSYVLAGLNEAWLGAGRKPQCFTLTGRMCTDVSDVVTHLVLVGTPQHLN